MRAIQSGYAPNDMDPTPFKISSATVKAFRVVDYKADAPTPFLIGRGNGADGSGRVLDSRRVRRGIVWTVSIIVVIAMVSYIPEAVFGHVGVWPPCTVNISVDILDGNRAAVRQAIASLKRTDTRGYAALCDNVDRIVERRCYGSDMHVDKNVRAWDAPACAIAGVRTIYVRPFGLSPSAAEVVMAGVALGEAARLFASVH